MTVINRALSQYGVKEIPGQEDNPVIVSYFSEIGHSWVKDDETAWCSAFANWVAKKENKAYSGKLNARSWLSVGKSVEVPEIGDIVVLWRSSKSSWKGHVGFFINQDDKYIYILGGNQNNQVCIRPYPKDRLLEYRRLNKVL